MKILFRLRAAISVVWFGSAISIFAQGSLTPPGPPGPTMKSLDQIEARTPISSAPYTISSPGSYYLTGNLSVANGDGITINANGVTLDLNGFTISSTASSASGSGILLAPGDSNITILNGNIAGGVTYSGGKYSGSGFAYGIFASFAQGFNLRVTGVSVSGCLTKGIYLSTNNSTVVESCTVNTVGSDGITAGIVSRSTAYQCGYSGIYANTADNCYGHSTGAGQGVFAYTANNCQGECTGSGYGIRADIASNCHATADSGIGLYVYEVASSCRARSNSGNGVEASTANNCYGSSSSNFGLTAHTANNCYGISVSGTGLAATDIAIGCVGVSIDGPGLVATIANSCRGRNSSGTSEIVTYKYNMP